MTDPIHDPLAFVTRYSSVLILISIVLVFSLVTPNFLTFQKGGNILKQSSFIGIAAIGMVFVLLTAGIDLSVGSTMYLAPLIAGFAMRDYGVGVFGALVITLSAGVLIGIVNAALIVGLRIIPFIVTLATLFLFRGAGAFLTSSRQLDFPPELRQFGQASVAGIPIPIIIFALMSAAAFVCLRHSAFGRQIYAFGNDPEAAAKAGLPVRRLQASVYVICSTCAALSGFVLISQIGRLDAGFGEGKEFDVIAAAVLGGASLFGGIGGAFSAILGALTIQVVKTGLVFSGVNLYLQPLLQGLIIFLAVFLDGVRQLRIETLSRRMIRPLES